MTRLVTDTQASSQPAPDVLRFLTVYGLKSILNFLGEIQNCRADL